MPLPEHRAREHNRNQDNGEPFRQLVASDEHAAVLEDLDKFDSLHRKNAFFDEGMGAIFRVKEGTAELQSFCFQPSKFTPARAEQSRGGTTQ